MSTEELKPWEDRYYQEARRIDTEVLTATNELYNRVSKLVDSVTDQNSAVSRQQGLDTLQRLAKACKSVAEVVEILLAVAYTAKSVQCPKDTREWIRSQCMPIMTVMSTIVSSVASVNTSLHPGAVPNVTLEGGLDALRKCGLCLDKSATVASSLAELKKESSKVYRINGIPVSKEELHKLDATLPAGVDAGVADMSPGDLAEYKMPEEIPDFAEIQETRSRALASFKIMEEARAEREAKRAKEESKSEESKSGLLAMFEIANPAVATCEVCGLDDRRAEGSPPVVQEREYAEFKGPSPLLCIGCWHTESLRRLADLPVEIKA